MTKTILTLLLVLLLAFQGVASDATSSWNEHAASFNFSGYPQSLSANFGSVYNGADFEADFAGIKAAVAADLQSTIPPWNGDDLFNGSLENWP